MAPLSVPPELKKIKPFVQRAEELDHAKSPESRVVAFYCRQFAVQQGIPLSGTSPAAKKCLGEILAQLEGEKQAMSVFSRAESKQICRGFADKIFEKANAEDRAGVADKGTARTFYAAATFLEILQQFNDETSDGEVVKEEDERRVYAKWKATEILKAIREGRKPTPGAFGESAEGAGEGGEEEEEVAAVSTEDGPSPPSPKAPPSAPVESPPPPVQPAAPDVFVPMPPPAEPEPKPDEGDEEGTEVGLDGPPPAYPGGDDDDDDDDDGDVFVPGAVKSAAARSVDRPPLTPAYEPPPPPAVPKASPPPVPAPAPAPKSTFSSRWGLGKKDSGGRVSKRALEDATELTKFALAALENKDSNLAAQRLQEALSALGR